jgi:branched-chain amino acid transport system substrate-binding protein
MQVQAGRPTRRRLLTTGIAAGATLAAPGLLRAQAPDPVQIGIVHPVEGFFGYAGRQCRAGVELAISDINDSGGIPAMDGARLEAVFVDAPVNPAQAMPRVDDLAERGVTALVGAYASTITLAVTQAARRHGLAVAVDVAVSDRIVQRNLPNVFRLGAGYSILASALAAQLAALGRRSDPITRAMIVHVDAPYGVGVVRRMRQLLDVAGVEIVSVQPQSPGLEDYTRFVRSVESERPGILIPALFYNDFANMKRALDGVAARPRLVAGLHAGPASSPLFLKEFPGFSEGVVDSTHWYDPASEIQARRIARSEERGIDYGHEVFMAANAVYLLADAIGRAGSRERDAVQAAMLSSTFAGHGMPYGPTRFIEGQNIGATAALTQVQDGAIRLIGPAGFSDSALRVGPLPPPELTTEDGSVSEGTLDESDAGDAPEPDFSTLQETPTDNPADAALPEPSPPPETPAQDP